MFTKEKCKLDVNLKMLNLFLMVLVDHNSSIILINPMIIKISSRIFLKSRMAFLRFRCFSRIKRIILPKDVV